MADPLRSLEPATAAQYVCIVSHRNVGVTEEINTVQRNVSSTFNKKKNSFNGPNFLILRTDIHTDSWCHNESYSATRWLVITSVIDVMMTHSSDYGNSVGVAALKRASAHRGVLTE